LDRGWTGSDFLDEKGAPLNRDLIVSPNDNWDVLPQLDSFAARPGHEVDSGLDLSRLVRILREWRSVIIAAAAAGFLGAIAITLLTTPMYRASVILEANPPTVEVIDQKAQSSGPSVDVWQFVATQVGLLQSRGLAERVAQDLGLEKDPQFADQKADPARRVKQAADQISANLAVAPQSDGQLIKFSFVSHSPELAANIANAYADSFIDASLQRRYEASSYARNFLQRQIASTRRELEKSERQLVQYAQEQGIINTGTSDASNDASSPQGQSLVALNEALAQATSQRIAAEGAYREALSVGNTSDVTADTQALRQARASLMAQYQQKRALMKPDHPEMVSLRSQISELDKQIAQESATVSKSRVNTALAAYKSALSAENALKAKVGSLKSDVLNLRGRSIQYAILQRDVDTNRALYDALLQRYKEIGVAGGIGESPVSIVDRANVPSAPFKPNIVLNVLVGICLGLLGGVLAAIGLDILNDTIRTPSDVRNKLRLPCLGSIPKRSGNARRTGLLEELDDPTSPAAESYATLATSLGFTTDEGLPHAFVVTSAKAAEGKSSSALALAHHFARLGKSVLLVDADLRKPSFRGHSEQKGLTSLLTTDEPLSENVTATKYENLWLLQCGPEPPNPAALLSSSRFRAVISEACSQYDLVIVDSPPLLGLADAPLIASVVKDTVMVVESGGTRTSAAIEAVHRLSAAGANILGVTLTKCSAKQGAHGYGYGYGYGYGRYGYGKGRYGAVKNRDDVISLIEHAED
jgi:capsular exopolysaccharide synthesis family protein